MRERRIWLAAAVLALMLAAWHRQGPSVVVRSASPHGSAAPQVEAAIDLGVVAISLLVNWGARQAR